MAFTLPVKELHLIYSDSVTDGSSNLTLRQLLYSTPIFLFRNKRRGDLNASDPSSCQCRAAVCMASVKSLDLSKLPNPLAPEAWLPRKEADANRTLHLAIVGLLSLTIWEFFQELPNDCRIIFGPGKFTIQTLAFITTRLSCIAFMSTSALALIIEVNDCHRWHMVTCLMYTVVHSAAGLLFYFRVAAVFSRNRRVIWFFRCAWVCLVVGGLMTAFIIDNHPIHPTRYCVTVVTSKAAVAVAMIQGSYDLLVCAAITYGLSIADNQGGLRWKDIFRFRRSTFRRLRERFLQDSQIYFMLTASTKIPEAIVFLTYYASERETPMQFIVAYPDTFLVATVATKIYRKLKLGQPGLLGGQTTIGMSVAEPDSETTDTRSSHVYPPTRSRRSYPSHP